MSFIPSAGDLADDDNGFNFTFPEEEKPQETAEQKVERLERENQELKNRPIPKAEPVEPKPAPAAPALIPSDSPEERRKKLGQALILNPGETVEQIMLTADQNARRNLIPLAANMNRMHFSTFKSASNMSPEVEKEFDKLTSNLDDNYLAALDGKTLPQQLQQLKYMAQGAALEGGWVPSARQTAPNYGTGGGQGGGGNRMNLTKEQREFVTLARNDYGWDDKQIGEALKDWDK